MKKKKGKSRSETLTVMFIDIVGYTKKTNQSSRDALNQMQDVFDALSIPMFEKYSGNVVKKIGDAFMITFRSPTNAILCGIELQNAFNNYNKVRKGKKPLNIRVAIHTGEVLIRSDGDVYGETVNTASRMESAAKAGQIVFSGTVFLVINKNEIPIVHLGPKRFKGLKQSVRMFKVKSKYDEILRRRKMARMKVKKVQKKFKSAILWIIMGLLLILVIAMIVTSSLLYHFLKTPAKYIG